MRSIFILVTFAGLTVTTASAYDIVKIEEYCQSQHKRTDDRKWCEVLEQSAGKLFDLALTANPTAQTRKKVVACLKKHPKSYQEAQPCLMKIVDKARVGELGDISLTQLPIYDTIGYCQKIKDTAGGSYQIEQTCRDSERENEASLRAIYVPDDVLKYCDKIGQTVGGSYQILKACVDQELAAKDGLQ